MYILATNNHHKVNELKAILNIDDIYSLDEVGFNQEIEEYGTTFEQNSLIKAQVIANAFPEATIISDDSGLCVKTLNMQPGVYSKRYANTGNDNDNNQLLLKNMEGVSERDAWFVCVLCLIQPNQEPVFFRGELAGTIATSLNGESGFGYDPLFLIDNQTTVAQLSEEEKNNISHRAQALSKLKDYLGV